MASLNDTRGHARDGEIRIVQSQKHQPHMIARRLQAGIIRA